MESFILSFSKIKEFNIQFKIPNDNDLNMEDMWLVPPALPFYE